MACPLTLAQRGFKSFAMTKTIRSVRYSATQLYLLRRQAMSMEQPYRQRCVTLIDQALRFKRTPPIPSRRPPQLPFLAHPHWTRDAQVLLLNKLRFGSAQLLPGHMPITKISHLKQPTLESHLHFWKQLMFRARFNHQPVCSCHAVLLDHPGTPTIDGHIVSAGSQLPESWNQVLRRNSKAQYFAGKTMVLAVVFEQLDRWTQH